MGTSLNIKENNLLIGLYVIITIVCLIALGPYLKIQKVVTFGLLPGLAAISYTQDSRTLIKNNLEIIFLILILVYGVASVFYYVDYEGYSLNISSLLGAIIAAYIPTALNKSKDYSNYFHIGYIASALILIVIMYINGNFSFTNFATKVDYRDRFLLNANAYSYFSFFASFSLFYLHQRYRHKLLTFLLLLLPVLFIIVSFVTQSRSGMLLVILINVCYWLFINKGAQNSQLAKLFYRLLIFVVFIIMSMQFIKIYENSRIKNRVESSVVKVDSREILLLESLNAFMDNPFFGVGLGQVASYTSFGQFSHNSYVEILAEQGIIGGILLFFLFGIPLKKCWQLLRGDPKNTLFRLNMLFFISFYLFNNLYPFYKFPFSMMYFFLIISIQNKLKP